MGLPRYWVNKATLNLVVEDTEFSYAGLGPGISLTRTYNADPSKSGMFGNGWNFSYESDLLINCNGVLLKKGSGQALNYSGPVCSGTPPILMTPPFGEYDSLTQTAPDSWLFERKENHWKYIYDSNYSPAGPDSFWGAQVWLRSIEDSNGNMVQLTYQGSRISAVTDAAGRATTFSYDGNGRCTAMTVPGAKTATYSYDARGNLTQTVDLLGTVTNYTYDSENFLTGMSVGDKTTSFSYEDTGMGKKISAVTDSLGNVTSYTASYGPVKVDVTETAPNGGTTLFTSQDGKITALQDPLNHTATAAYQIDTNVYTTGKSLGAIDANGSSTSATYDARGNLIQKVVPDSRITNFTYDPSDNLLAKTTVIVPSNETWSYTYDGRNRTRITSPMGRQTAMTYFPNGLLETLTDPSGNSFSYTYDNFGNLLTKTDPLGNISQMGYDSQGINKTSITDALNNTTLFEYDANRRLIKVTHPDGSLRTITYDCCAPVAFTDENGNTTTFQRSKLLEPILLTDPLGNKTKYTYDANGNLTGAVDALGNIVSQTFDQANRPVNLVNALGASMTRGYDPKGNMTSLTDERGHTTLISYNGNNEPASMTDPLGNTISWDRDRAGRISKIVSNGTKTVGFTYNADGQATGKSYNGTSVSTYIYDSGGNLSGFTDATGTTVYAYDELNRIKEITYPDLNKAVFTYNEVGRLQSVVYPGGVEASYAYNSRNRVSSVSWGSNSVAFSYDPVGNLLSETRTNGTQTTYAYDKRNLVSSIVHSKNALFAQMDYVRNAVGNIVQETSTLPVDPALATEATVAKYNNANQISNWGGDTYGYDGFGNLTGISGSKTFSASYDLENRPISITLGGKTVAYSYNGLGQRTQVVTATDTAIHHYDARGRLLFVSNGAGEITAYYIYSGNRLTAMGTPGEGYYFYHYEKNGNTIALTDSTGGIAAAYAYSPYGEIMNRVGTIDNPFTYVGAYGVIDEGNGLYFMKNRYYDASTGRFIQKDPIGLDGGINLYRYVLNNPINLIDPSGLDTDEWGGEIEHEIERPPLSPEAEYTKVFIEEFLDIDNLGDQYMENLDESLPFWTIDKALTYMNPAYTGFSAYMYYCAGDYWSAANTAAGAIPGAGTVISGVSDAATWAGNVSGTSGGAKEYDPNYYEQNYFDPNSGRRMNY